jgi:D-beta-D-heptose 7-phosphate kinase/D-beta-D-heptose 1-phosphate adenosyltransferase
MIRPIQQSGEIRVELDIPPFDRGRVLVVGDLMLDRYWQGDTSRISPEAPVPVVSIGETADRPGGAGNVALNVTSLGAVAMLAGFTGDDDAGAALLEQLERAGVECHIARLPGYSTITKLRVLSRHQQLLRLDFDLDFSAAAAPAFHGLFSDLAERAHVILLSDYGKGTLSRVQALIAAARDLRRPVLVDPKGRDFHRYRGATMLTPNLAEFEAIVGPCPDESVLIGKAQRLRAELALEALLITRGRDGMTLVREGAAPLHLPAHAREVYDVTGAGDTVIAVLAAAWAAGAPIEQATALANLAAGVVVGKLGAASVSTEELREALRGRGHVGPAVVDEHRLVTLIGRARARGETLVMTNGCFDILHAGHVKYLEQARAMGDRLIVAVNDDASVARLKGRGRPIVPLAQRMAVLAALQSVDWVVPFSEDTPERLICRLLPDVLVKGGDYRPEDVAGGNCVERNGGRVAILDYVPECSTSRIIETIRRQTG